MQTLSSKPLCARCALIALALFGTMTASSRLAAAAEADERPFLAESEAAMNKMMDGMGVRPSGDVDQDFVAMMVPHHQGAIGMAQAELRHGKNEQLRRIAQEIIVDQQQEIAAMDLALDQPLPLSMPSPTQVSAPVPAQTPTTGAMPAMAGMHAHHATN
jgi:hypothetical protein